MHRYLHNYEDFLLIDDDYVARVSSKFALGPKKKPHGGSWDEDDDFEGFDDDYESEYDEGDDDEDRDYDERYGDR